MNYDLLEKRPSVQRLLEILGQERIMELYFGEKIILGKKYRNPFRDDKHAGCSFKWTVKSNLMFYDGATEQGCYGVFQIASLKTGIQFPQILKKIESDFQLNTLKLADIKALELEKREIPEVIPADIRFNLTSMKKSDTIYWQQFGISVETLRFYDVRKVEKVWINGKLWYLPNDFDPCYRYKEKEKFKTYRPLARKKNKFRCNFFGGLLEGWEQLPDSGDLLIITKGRKDVMSLFELGYNAVAVRSENTPVSVNAMDLLRPRFKNTVFWYDNDKSGRIFSKIMREKFNLPSIEHDLNLPKDPSDIIRDLGKNKVINIIEDWRQKNEQN